MENNFDTASTVPGIPPHFEAELQNAGIDCHAILEAFPAAAWLCDRNGFVRVINRHAVSLAGRMPRLGEDQWCISVRSYSPNGKLLLPAETPAAYTWLHQEPCQGKAVIMEKKDGSRRMVKINTHLLRGNNRQPVAVLCVASPTATIYNDQHSLLAAIVADTSDAVYSVSQEGFFTTWNKGAETIFGYTETEVLGKHISMIIPPDQAAEFQQLRLKISLGEQINHHITKRLSRDGRTLNLVLTVSPIRVSGELQGVSVFAREFTPINRLQQLVQEGEERFRQAVAATNLGTWDLDFLTEHFQLSAVGRATFGFSATMPVNLHMLYSRICPEYLTVVKKSVATAIADNKKGYFDITFPIYRYDDNATRWLNMRGHAYFNEREEAERIIGTILDITLTHQLTAELEDTVRSRTIELERTVKMLEHSNEELREFAHLASHDLQIPIQNIQTYAAAGKAQEEAGMLAMPWLERISGTANRMSALIAEVLAWSGLPQTDAAMTTVDLQQIMETVLQDLGPMISERKADIHCDNLPCIRGMHLPLYRLFQNILSNSLKFSKRQPLLSVTAQVLTDGAQLSVPGLEPGVRYLRLRFTDNGVGFDPNIAEKIFERFYRGPHQESYTGNGIGLAVCRRIAEMHGGKIYASSEVGAGTRIDVFLPAI
ncbi:PAS domain S-box-containing protein [Chitinophaga dinghuensis]|uniref:histidine kinase n=1 Tax=Chitinophaga dinghuensis TaxID=1539050 RepID=A0A327VSW0_9BACT|nr:PAS domain S-box protein [Chitinophaga dinghuensis]RAJ79137.1 PAS domain S-box-containing protein [Chitinophaga dinghuensis]